MLAPTAFAGSLHVRQAQVPLIAVYLRPLHDGRRGSSRASDSDRDGRGWKMSAAGEGAVGPLWIVCGRGGGGVGRGHVSLR